MILYHGSNVPIGTIDLSLSKPNKDFGRAFYLSDTNAQAMEMAQAKCIQFGGTPCVTAFEVDETQMTQLNRKIFNEYCGEWARGVTFQYAFCTPEAVKLLHKI